jgi:hypothetical protein
VSCGFVENFHTPEVVDVLAREEVRGGGVVEFSVLWLHCIFIDFYSKIDYLGNFYYYSL